MTFNLTVTNLTIQSSNFTANNDEGQLDFSEEFQPYPKEHSNNGWTLPLILITVIPLAFIILEIILGNLLVIISVITQRHMRTPQNMLILSLAITDLTVGMFVLPFNIADMILGWRWGTVLCRVWLTSDVALSSASVLHICAIAVDRFRSVNEGISYVQSRSIKMAFVNCATLWLIALWIASAPVLGWNDWNKQKTDPKDDMFVCSLARNLGYVLHSALGALIVPTIIMVAIYFRIFFLIRSKLHSKSKMSLTSTSGTMKNPDVKILTIAEEAPVTNENNKDLAKKSGKILDSQKSHSKQIKAILLKKVKHSLKKERRAAKRLGVIIGAFVICWTPFTIVYVFNGILTFIWPERDCVPVWLFQGVTWLAYSNSGVNPIIYTMYSKQFKLAFMDTLKWLFLCKTKKSTIN